MSEEQQQQYPPAEYQSRGLYSDPQSYVESQHADHLVKVLTDHEDTLDILKMQMRGEIVYQDKEGQRFYKQIDKPAFVILDELNKPVKVYNEQFKQWDYIPNDEAINEVVSILKFIGMNPVAPMTTIDENEIRADLMEMESKITVLLTINRKKWGIDKSMFPVIIGKLKVLIKDARYRSKDGTVIKALRTITSRIEQENTQFRKPGFGDKIKSIYS